MNHHDHFIYNADGTLTWKPRPREHFRTNKGWRVFRARFEGKPAGTDQSMGYRSVIIQMKSYLTHRIIWEMHYGPIPKGMQVDHINGIRNDNRIENLRLATNSQNGMNKGPQSNNQRGLKGVRFDPRRKKRPYSARIMFGGKDISLGQFPTAEEAHAAYCVAAVKYHGTFSKTG